MERCARTVHTSRVRRSSLSRQRSQAAAEKTKFMVVELEETFRGLMMGSVRENLWAFKGGKWAYGTVEGNQLATTVAKYEEGPVMMYF